MKIRARQGDLVLSVSAILGGILILILTKVQGLLLVKSGKMGPGFFPAICGIAIIICGLLLLAELWHSRRRSGVEETGEGEENLFNVNELRNLLLFTALGAMVLLLSKYIGLLTCLGLCVILYLKLQGKESWLKSMIIGVCMSGFLYAVFVLFLHVPVPKGPFGF